MKYQTTSFLACSILLSPCGFAQNVDPGSGSKIEIKDGAVRVETKSSGTGNQSSSSSSSHTDAAGNTITTIVTEVNGVRETRRVVVSRDGKVDVDTVPNEAPSANAPGKPKQAPQAEEQTETGGWLGVHSIPLSETVRAQIDIPEGKGILVEFVAPDSPAAKAGVAENDVLLKLNATAITSVAQFRQLLSEHPPGTKLTLDYQRKGKPHTAQVTLEQKPHEPESDPAPNGPNSKSSKRLRFMNADGKIDTFEGDGDPFEKMLNNPAIPEEMKAQMRKAQEQMKQFKAGK